ncbi:DUF2357 domain-containing protein [Niveibacterium sp. COAC-50]|uniref:DUF2357 domain-containing protein n=1 Tax=Niveibacterium sp. COAC-50 TaxID=2729384 RepID=UPI001555D6AE|nr:DUF2357 domain-containing protein [Niveibacterium sp. COAC-50]
MLACEFVAARPAPCSLVVDEVPLTVVPGKTNAWTWSPAFFAGTVMAELMDTAGRVICRYRLDVSPDPAKLGQDAFVAMLDAIYEQEPALLMGSESTQFEIGAEGAVTALALEYARIRQYGDELLHALNRIAARPLTHTTHDREVLPINQVRRLDQRSLIAMRRNVPALAAVAGHLDDAVAALGFDVPFSRPDLDTPAHRALLTVVHAVLRRLRSVRDELVSSAASDASSETRTSVAPRLPYRLNYLNRIEGSLRRACASAPLSHASRREISAAALNTISAHPTYARAYKSCWRILRQGIAGAARDELLWMSPTWEVYERWCFLEVFRCIKDSVPGLVWSRKYPSKRDDGIVYRGESADGVVTLYLQPRFPAFDQPPWRGFRSLSGERRPDIVLTSETATGKKFAVLDAKYRTHRSAVLDAMSSAHIYQDSLRWGDQRAEMSLLLVPAGGGALGLESSAFIAAHRVGVVPISHGTPTSDFCSIVLEAIGLA